MRSVKCCIKESKYGINEQKMSSSGTRCCRCCHQWTWQSPCGHSSAAQSLTSSSCYSQHHTWKEQTCWCPLINKWRISTTLSQFLVMSHKHFTWIKSIETFECFVWEEDGQPKRKVQNSFSNISYLLIYCLAITRIPTPAILCFIASHQNDFIIIGYCGVPIDNEWSRCTYCNAHGQLTDLSCEKSMLPWWWVWEFPSRWMMSTTLSPYGHLLLPNPCFPPMITMSLVPFTCLTTLQVCKYLARLIWGPGVLRHNWKDLLNNSKPALMETLQIST